MHVAISHRGREIDEPRMRGAQGVRQLLHLPHVLVVALYAVASLRLKFECRLVDLLAHEVRRRSLDGVRGAPNNVRPVLALGFQRRQHLVAVFLHLRRREV